MLKETPLHAAAGVGAPRGASAVAQPRGRTATVVIVALAVALVVAALVSATLGQFPVGIDEIGDSLLRRLSGPQPVLDAGALTDTDRRQLLVDGSLWEIRFPRIVLGMVVGASLGIAGALTQGLFGNPLAEPGIIGTSAGAAVGACAVIVTGVGTTTLGTFAQPMGAFVGAVMTTVIVYSMARARGHTQVITLILTGIAVNAVANALIALFMFLADQASRDSIVFWQLGSLNGALWRSVWTTAPLLALGFAVAMFLAPSLDLLALGEAPARHLGVRVERLRVVTVAVLALLTAAAVADAGIIAFVGLVVPHLFRIWLGPSHRTLIPASALGGALLIALADIAARTLVPYADLPIGMFTAFLGGPVFYLLLRRFTRAGA